MHLHLSVGASGGGALPTGVPGASDVAPAAGGSSRYASRDPSQRERARARRRRRGAAALAGAHLRGHRAACRNGGAVVQLAGCELGVRLAEGVVVTPGGRHARSGRRGSRPRAPASSMTRVLMLRERVPIPLEERKNRIQIGGSVERGLSLPRQGCRGSDPTGCHRKQPGQRHHGRLQGRRRGGEAFPSMLVNQLETGAKVGTLGLGRTSARSRRTTSRARPPDRQHLRPRDRRQRLVLGAGPERRRLHAQRHLHVDAKGQLVTADGSVLDDGGRPITIGAGKASITPDGRVSVDGRQIAKLALTSLDPDAPAQARRQPVHRHRPEGRRLRACRAGLPRELQRELGQGDGRPDLDDAELRGGPEGRSGDDDSLGKAVNDVGRIS